MSAAPLAFDLFAPGSAATAVLFAARVSGLVLVAPVFSARTLSPMLKAALIVVLTLLLQPAALARVTTVPAVTPAAALAETLVGFAIGLGAALVVGAAQAAGDLMSTGIGLSGAAIFDPINNTQVPVLGQFMQLFALTLLLASNAHLVMLDALAASTRYVPVGSAVDMHAGARALLSLGGSLFALGLRFAAPVIAAVMVSNVALAVLSRAAPQLNVLSVAFPLQIATGLFALAGSLALVSTLFSGWEGAYDSSLTGVLDALRGGAGAGVGP
jgi:flagellar biosynthetic protein FliR